MVDWSVCFLYIRYFTVYFDFVLVFMLDTGRDVFVWLGHNASKKEKKNAMSYAHVSVFKRKRCLHML